MNDRTWKVLFNRLDSLIGKEIYLVSNNVEILRGLLISYDHTIEYNKITSCTLRLLDQSYTIGDHNYCIPRHDKIIINYNTKILWD